MYYRGIHEGMGPGGWILITLLVLVVVAVVVWAVIRIAPSRRGEDREPVRPAEEPLAILDRRLASGEVDAETYDQLKSRLSSRPPAGAG